MQVISTPATACLLLCVMDFWCLEMAGDVNKFWEIWEGLHQAEHEFYTGFEQFRQAFKQIWAKFGQGVERITSSGDVMKALARFSQLANQFCR